MTLVYSSDLYALANSPKQPYSPTEMKRHSMASAIGCRLTSHRRANTS